MYHCIHTIVANANQESSSQSNFNGIVCPLCDDKLIGKETLDSHTCPIFPIEIRLSLAEYQGMLVAALFFIVEKLLRVLLLLVPAGLVMDYLPDW
ncbi:hypothetical protein LPJ54_001599, partial [Coemansia sp. RSA 1824]